MDKLFSGFLGMQRMKIYRRSSMCIKVKRTSCGDQKRGSREVTKMCGYSFTHDFLNDTLLHRSYSIPARSTPLNFVVDMSCLTPQCADMRKQESSKGP